MEIKDRLLKIISSEGLNSSAFADSIGVQRSSISHILSGRNKPSIDFLEKILSSYPKYNAEWLIMGTGEITKTPKQPSLFQEVPIRPAVAQMDIIPVNESYPIPSIHRVDVNTNPQESVHTEAEKASNEEPPVHYSIPVVPAVTGNRKIDRIVIFYDDRTFIEYKPGK